MTNKSREAKQECQPQIAQMRRTYSAESDSSALLSEAARSLGVLPAPHLLPDPREPGLYVDFLGQTLDFAIFPHESRRPLAIGSGIISKTRAWEWICEQICADALRPEWRHRAFAGQPGVIFANPFREIALARKWRPNCSPAGLPLRIRELRNANGSWRPTTLRWRNSLKL